ncbi:MAG TPA: NfeD family protein, partial [Daejeonella sp.]|nr:NfeD family protein [Daejeonella sp.]
FVLFILEVKITSYGVLGIGGVIALTLGSIMLIRAESALEFMKISWGVIVPTTLVTAAFFFFLVGMAVKGQKLKSMTGIEGIIGEEGEALARLEPSGTVRVHGELWNAESVSGSIERGQKIIVKAIRNLTLYVDQLNK